jgi:hypothetical protein
VAQRAPTLTMPTSNLPCRSPLPWRSLILGYRHNDGLQCRDLRTRFLAALAMIVAILLRKFMQVSDGVTTEKS